MKLSNISKAAGFAITLLVSAWIFSCTLDPYLIPQEELYTRNFIKKFGLIDPEQDWNQAKQAVVNVKLGDVNVSKVKIYGKQDSKYYLIADLDDVSGELAVPVDIPKSCKDILVKANGRKYYGTIDRPIDCSSMSRGVPDDGTNGASTYYEGWNNDAVNTNPPVYENTSGGYSIKVQHTTSGKTETGADNGCYQYFNTQQMAPLVSPEIWSTYYSLNTEMTTTNPYPSDPSKGVGLVPESGQYNRTLNDIKSWLDEKNAEGREMVIDFTVNPGDNGKFTIFPYYYGTNLVHELGIYLLDENGDPITKSAGQDKSNSENWVKFPIFHDRQKGDLQVNPHYGCGVGAIRVYDSNGYEISYDNPLRLTVGDEYQLPFKLFDGENVWQDYGYRKASVEGYNEIAYDDNFKSTYHSRVAFHAYTNEEHQDIYPDAPIKFVECTKDGKIKALKATDDQGLLSNNMYWMVVAIATGLGNDGITRGVHYDFPIIISNRPAETHYHTETTTTWPSDLTDHSWHEYFSNTPTPEADNVLLKINNGNAPVNNVNNYKDNNGYFKYSYTDNDNVTHYLFKEIFEYFATSDNVKTWIDSHPSDIALLGPNRELNDNNNVAYNNLVKLYNAELYTAKYITNEWNTTGYKSDGDYSYLVDPNASGFDWASFTFADINLPNNMGQYYFNGGDIIVYRTGTPTDLSSSTDYHWRENGKEQVKNVLEAYYSNHVPTTYTDCTSGKTYTLTLDNVAIDDDADYNNIKYYVTWKHTEVLNSASQKPRNAMSRDGGTSSKPAILNYDATIGWKDVSCCYSKYLPMGEEVASYPPNQAMLGRSRGYDVTLTDANGRPYVGNFGMYLKVIESKSATSFENEEANKGQYDQLQNDDDFEGYVVFSERKYNRDAQNKLSNQISAISMKHPITGRTFFAFEDMRLTHAGPGESGGSSYNGYEKSSDRDINDMIFLITNYSSISSGDGSTIKEEEEVDEGFPWIWAVEDLGATDDFDFNDLVVKITSLTTKVKTPVTVGNTTTDTYSVLSKVVTFTPLAAGGTLPLFIHLKNGNDDYVLYPGGVFNITGDANFTVEDVTFDNNNLLSSESDAQEIHKWFGNGTFATTEMINTGKGPSNQKAKSCTLYVPAPTCDGSTGVINNDGFQINIFSDGKTIENANAQSSTVHFYVTVDHNGLSESNINHELLNIENRELGKAPQSFIIKADNWDWPTERQNIIDKYPKFGEWINDASYDWISNK